MAWYTEWVILLSGIAPVSISLLCSYEVHIPESRCQRNGFLGEREVWVSGVGGGGGGSGSLGTHIFLSFLQKVLVSAETTGNICHWAT